MVEKSILTYDNNDFLIVILTRNNVKSEGLEHITNSKGRHGFKSNQGI